MGTPSLRANHVDNIRPLRHGDRMSGAHMSEAEERVWAQMPEGTRKALADLPGTDLQTLLLSMARTRAATVTPADLMRRWRRSFRASGRR